MWSFGDGNSEEHSKKSVNSFLEVESWPPFFQFPAPTQGFSCVTEWKAPNIMRLLLLSKWQIRLMKSLRVNKRGWFPKYRSNILIDSSTVNIVNGLSIFCPCTEEVYWLRNNRQWLLQCIDHMEKGILNGFFYVPEVCHLSLTTRKDSSEVIEMIEKCANSISWCF